MRAALPVAVILALALSLAGCGRKSMPDWPEDSTYPNAYPNTPLPAKTKTRTNTNQ